MSAVTKQEIVAMIEGLIESDACMGSISNKQAITALELVNRIKQHGIAPPDGCSTHPKARHGFARQASHSEGEYVCECAGFDPYDAGYQDGIWAAWDADGRLLPDGWVLVKDKPVCWAITGDGKFDMFWHGIRFGSVTLVKDPLGEYSTLENRK